MSASLRYSCLCNCLSATALAAGCFAVLMLVFPVAEIILGVVYLYECPAAPLLPVYVIVCGVLAVLLVVLLALLKLFCPAASSGLVWTVVLLILVTFTCVWFFYGSYLVYSIYPPNYTKTPSAAKHKPDLNLDQDQNQDHNQTHSLDQNQDQNQNQNHSLNQNQDQDQNQNQSHSLNQNQTQAATNRTLLALIQTSSLSSNSSAPMTREPLNAPQMLGVGAGGPYCNRTMYLFVFWTTTLVYVLSGNALLIFLCVYGCMKLGNTLVKMGTF